MRPEEVLASTLILTAVLLVAGCTGTPSVRTSSRPSVTPSATAAPTPVATGTIHNDRTSFLVRLRSVRVARHFRVGRYLAEDAPPGTELVIARIMVMNTGQRPSHLETAGQQPFVLLDTEGGTHGIERSWAIDQDFPPGSWIVEPYVFLAPRGKKPAYLTATLIDANGNRSVAGLTLPGHAHPTATPSNTIA